MSFVKSLVRSLVAAPKQLYYEPELGLQLDLSYITPQLIVSSAPTTTYIESWYRYPLGDLLKYLNLKHPHHWWLFNFRGEEPGYLDEDVQGKVNHYPFPDHYPPTMDIIMKAVKEIDEYLKLSNENVAVLHCKAGKGRLGTICCAYLMYEKLLYRGESDIAVDEIVSYYTQKRMRSITGMKGVSILSQQRYLEYWRSLIVDESGKTKEAYMEWKRAYRESFITHIVFRNCTQDEVSFLVSEYVALSEDSLGRQNTVAKQLFNTLSTTFATGAWKRDQSNDLIYSFQEPQRVGEDVMIRIGRVSYLWFNTYFEALDYGKKENILLFSWREMDGFKGTRQQGTKCFDSIEIHFAST
ncbi:hypothetical protein LELG_05111 [Lodderomyces elongisporus NRRL YB-4239]|uniref:Uncharacterized protein n=1 Tax=Lodderomyces elongisporus (strain ATCC 11503 / CBS 2605 / JCM 1781 / NBRC 1676 / NRRL YB-4239) TaxID=379508 RepID=A5E672_LODEL|nr:hypothetical protein LELG_05111 [Lodderomyces elongisporus NRRL YB-4239]